MLSEGFPFHQFNKRKHTKVWSDEGSYFYQVEERKESTIHINPLPMQTLFVPAVIAYPVLFQSSCNTHSLIPGKFNSFLSNGILNLTVSREMHGANVKCCSSYAYTDHNH